MRVLVTGAGGFVGSHTVGALLAAGLKVRAAARTVDGVRAALRPHGWAADVEAVAMDMLAPDQVADALRRCDAVVHCAAVYSHDARRAREVLACNARGTELVLGTAGEQRLVSIVHVSSYVALLPAPAPLGADSPLGRPPTPYARSKVAAERVAVRLLGQGVPVTVVSPGMVFGPADPSFGESTRLVWDVACGRVQLGVPGTVPVVDVRDAAAVLAAAVVSAPLRRVLAVAAVLPMTTVLSTLAAAAGQPPPRAVLPAPLAAGSAWLSEGVERVLGRRLPLNRQSVWTTTHGPAEGAWARAAGVDLRPAEESLVDTVEWLLASDRTGVAAGLRPTA